MNRPVAILGAGPAGIGAGLALGAAATVFERSKAVAGLSRTIVLDDAVFDLGGHSFHTPHRHIRDLVFDAVKMEEQRRSAWCWTHGQWIAYPFQQHVADLADPQVRAACLAGLAGAGDARSAPDFDAYLEVRFGRALADTFMRPYNRKLWGPDLSRLTIDWTGERVAGPVADSERFALDGGHRTPLQADTHVAYPSHGGFGTIFEALSMRLSDLRLGTEVVEIDGRGRTMVTRSGETFGWDEMVSTLPLPTLLAMVKDVPPAIRTAVARLEAIPVDLVMLVLEDRAPVDRQRVYCPEPDMPGHKIVLNHTSSQWLRSLARHGIQVEVSRTSDRSGSDLVEVVLQFLMRIGLIASRSQVRRSDILRLPLGYPVPTRAGQQTIRETRAWLADRNIHISGRFAEWAYINADEALARGFEAGRSLAALHAKPTI